MELVCLIVMKEETLALMRVLLIVWCFLVAAATQSYMIDKGVFTLAIKSNCPQLRSPKLVGKLTSLTHTHTHTYIYIYENFREESMS